jgi:hypothetical protein
LLFDDYAPVTRELLGDERIAWLRQLPDEHREDNVVLVHASPGDLWRAPLPDAEDSKLTATYASCDAETVIEGMSVAVWSGRCETRTSGDLGDPLGAGRSQVQILSPRLAGDYWSSASRSALGVRYLMMRKDTLAVLPLRRPVNGIASSW